MKRKVYAAGISSGIFFSGIRSASTSTRTKRFLISAATFFVIVLVFGAFSVFLNADLSGNSESFTSSPHGQGKGKESTERWSENSGSNHLIRGSSTGHGTALTIKKNRRSGSGTSRKNDPTTSRDPPSPPLPLVVSEALAARFLNQIGLFYPPPHRDSGLELDPTESSLSLPASPFYVANGAHRQINLPYTYPLHLSLPKDRNAMARSILSQFFEKPPQMDDDNNGNVGDNNRHGHMYTIGKAKSERNEQQEETGEDSSEGKSKAHNIPTAPIESTSNAAQCLRRSREAPVLFLDVEALKIADIEKDRREEESDAANEALALISKSLRSGGVIRDVTLSDKLEREFGFDNKVLYGRVSTRRRGKGRELSSRQPFMEHPGNSDALDGERLLKNDDNQENKKDAKVDDEFDDGREIRIGPLVKERDASSKYRWDSAIFYRNIASDAHVPNHPNATIRKSWERSKVRWVAVDGNDKEDKVGSNNRNMMRVDKAAAGTSDSRTNEEKEELADDNDEGAVEQWWDYDDEAEDGNLPCTQYVQHRLHALMNPRTCRGRGGAVDSAEINKRSVDGTSGFDDDSHDDDPFEVRKQEEIRAEPKFLISHLKSPNEGFGTGAAISLVAFDLLSATVLNRVLLMKTSSSSRVGGRINTKKWHFASETCAEAGHASWDCFWQFPSRCQYEVDPFVTSHPMKIRSKKEALRNAKVISIVKENFDAKGLGRNDVPSDEDFFGNRFVHGLRRRRREKRNRKMSGEPKEGSNDRNSPFYTSPPKCYMQFKKWAEQDLSHTYVQGTFSRGADARLFYMMSQAMRYLLRYQQPWFYNMLAQGLGYVGMGQGVPSAESFELVIAENSGMFGWEVRERKKNNNDDDGVRRLPPPIENGGKMMSTLSKRQKEDQRQEDVLLPATLYIHERGEINKFREYYSNFGCHNVKSELLIDLATTYCLGGIMDRQGGEVGLGEEVPDENHINQNNGIIRGLRYKGKNGMVFLRDHPKYNYTLASPSDAETARWYQTSPCHVFISGNTPSGNYRYLRSKLEEAADGGREDSSSSSSLEEMAMTISSTWNLFEPARLRRTQRGRKRKIIDGDGEKPSSDGNRSHGAETARWGANSPSAGWIDLYAGASSSHWACIVQSNWCRLVNWLRLTSGRAVCGGFADLGTLMLSSPTLRDGYCIVNMTWPTKAFSNRIK